MSWISEYRTALARAFVREGDAHLSPRPGWRSYGQVEDYKKTVEMREHLSRDRVWFLKSDPTEVEWSEFAGTFADDPWPRITGLEAVVSCSCSQFKEVAVVMRATSFSEILKAILSDDE